MPIVTHDVVPGIGPLLDFSVGVTTPREQVLKAVGKPVPPPQSVRGLIDTGASHTVLDKSIITGLCLNPSGITRIKTPSTGQGTHQCYLYDVKFHFISNQGIRIPLASLPSLPVLECDLSAQGIQALIGRDVLASCALFYNGDVSRFALAF